MPEEKKPHQKWGYMLEQEADRLGVSRYGTFNGQTLNIAELQRRIWQAKREKRDARLWWIAFISALASLASALAAWHAVVSR